MFTKVLLTLFICANVKSQSNKDLYNGQYSSDYYNTKTLDRPRDSRLPKPGDSDYRTYVYNNRRYGTDPSRYNPYNPNINQPGGFPYNPIITNPLDDQFKYNTNRDSNNPDALFPGVLGGWREDLQGRERRDSRQLKRDIFVNTNFGQVQGFKTEAGATAQKYPVMVYIHGGQYASGASNLFPAHTLSAFYDVVVVSFNYRLGALGFLSTGDENSPGNYGILDQAMALRWIRDNIVRFNGDPGSVTLFGPGAGAASAGLLAVAPQTRDIVTSIIAQSGSALADWAIIEDKYRVQNTSLVFGRLLGCPIDSSWKLVNCLRQGRSFYELGNAEFEPNVGFIPWGPVLENNFTFPGDEWYEGWRERDWHFLSTMPEELIARRQFNPALRYMTGVTTQEAAYVLYMNNTLAPDFMIDERWFDMKVQEFVLRYNYTLNPRGVYEAIRYMYTYHPEPHNVTAIRDQYINFLSDFLYRAPTDKIVKLLLEQNVPVYMYVLNTTVEAFNWPQWRQYAHDTEHFFLTGAPFMDQEFFPRRHRIERQAWTPNDRNMSHFFMKSYADFARFGYFWWEPQQPLQIAFWSVSSACILLIVLLVVLCMLWRNAKRDNERYYNGDIFIVPELEESGIDNATRSRDNIYEYRDVPVKRPHTPQTLTRTISQPQTLQSSRAPSEASTESAISLKESVVSKTPDPRVPAPMPRTRSRTQMVHGVPQTTV
ncbi:jg22183 [Pararge aegeria aegeria]|uniref:Jg22183 protein n=1 Tax=Pararge aegeria aegeria TaxID=348720 RepID=A0A8S4S5N9_9NEOP|nr:jg22183 [Pararge aegeria aegeria]